MLLCLFRVAFVFDNADNINNASKTWKQTHKIISIIAVTAAAVTAAEVTAAPFASNGSDSDDGSGSGS